MPTDRLERSGLNRAWIEATAALPFGWQLDGPDVRFDRAGAGAALRPLEKHGPLARRASGSSARTMDPSRRSTPWHASCGRCGGRREARFYPRISGQYRAAAMAAAVMTSSTRAVAPTPAITR